MKISFSALAISLLVSSVVAVPAANSASKSASGTASKSASRTASKSASSTKPPGAMSTGNSGSSGTSGPNAAGACSQAVQDLAAGISANIADQRNEVAAVTAVGDVLGEVPMNPVTFAASKASLLDFVNKGIAIRENNQKIAPPGNGAIAGLAIVANAQQAEFNLTNSLTGDAAIDNATVATLKMDFSGGIEQNMKNLAAATANCTMPAAAAARIKMMLR
ncbi:hypothetical protein BP5796_13197 [Coleophoma crateriformis]|uniref:Cell wall protein n=1 Tax=Coleophoma crateriformis TaxID=565419 RepID=A0A3D8Q487_9HELO|nr:hypothetical protein BP5796_13197 [Coleophoma crateriformis]